MIVVAYSFRFSILILMGFPPLDAKLRGWWFLDMRLISESSGRGLVASCMRFSTLHWTTRVLHKNREELRIDGLYRYQSFWQNRMENNPANCLILSNSVTSLGDGRPCLGFGSKGQRVTFFVVVARSGS
jgi:hypothetical protein